MRTPKRCLKYAFTRHLLRFSINLITLQEVQQRDARELFSAEPIFSIFSPRCFSFQLFRSSVATESMELATEKQEILDKTNL